MKALVSLVAFITAFLTVFSPAYAQGEDWTMYWVGDDNASIELRQSPFSNQRFVLNSVTALKLPTLYRRDFGPLPNGARLPLYMGPDVPDIGKATWQVWRFGDFVLDGFHTPSVLFDRFRSSKVRVVPYRPLPPQSGNPVPHLPSGLALGRSRIPILNYSPDMVSGYPCDAGMSPREVGGKRPQVWFEASGPRATGASLIPDDPCVTQRALDIAVLAMSYASPDRSMREFLDGLREIEGRASDLSFGAGDTGWMYNQLYMNPQQQWLAIDANLFPAHGGLSYFLPDGHREKRLYWLLLHPHGDSRLHPIGYPFDAELFGGDKAEKGLSYWRQQQLGSRKELYTPVLPWIGRIGIRFALYSPDDALVCARYIPYEAIPNEAKDYEPLNEFSMAACEFAAGPHTRLEGSHLTQAVVYLIWDSGRNQWFFEDVVIGNSLWYPIAGIGRYTPPVLKETGTGLNASAIMHRLLPSYTGFKR